jgi:O-antigen/teichoic acid export membrane protein
MVMSYPQQAAHQYAVSAMVSPELFAIYAIGVFQLPLVDLFYTPTSEVLMVRIGELEKHKRLDLALEAFREAASKLSLLFLPMVAFLFAAAPEFISACFGAKFLPAVPIFRVGIWSIALASLPMDGVLRARNSTRHIFWSYFLKTAVTVPLVYFLVKHFGMRGGIWSWLIAEIIGKASLLVRVPYALSAPERRRTFREIIPWRNVGRAGIAALSAGLAVFAVRRLIPFAAPHVLPDSLVARVVPLLVATVLFGVGYLAALRVQGVRPFAVFSVLLRRRAAAA